MRNRNGRWSAFTLVEVLICLAVIGAVSFPFIAMVHQMVWSYTKAINYNDLRTERDRVGHHLISKLRYGKNVSIAKDNRSVTWIGGKAEWDGGQIQLQQGSQSYLLARDVTHFSVHRIDGSTRLTLELKDPRSQKSTRSSFIVEERHRAKRF